MAQLSLYELYDREEKNETLSKRAIALLDALNDGERNPYEPFAWDQVNEFIVLIAKRKEEYLFNLIDLDGKIPSGSSSCWRNLSLVKQDLKELIA